MLTPPWFYLSTKNSRRSRPYKERLNILLGCGCLYTSFLPAGPAHRRHHHPQSLFAQAGSIHEMASGAVGWLASRRRSVGCLPPPPPSSPVQPRVLAALLRFPPPHITYLGKPSCRDHELIPWTFDGDVLLPSLLSEELQSKDNEAVRSLFEAGAPVAAPIVLRTRPPQRLMAHLAKGYTPSSRARHSGSAITSGHRGCTAPGATEYVAKVTSRRKANKPTSTGTRPLRSPGQEGESESASSIMKVWIIASPLKT
jgi:hypothetical protein